MNYFKQESERLIFRKLELNDIDDWSNFFINNDRLIYLGIDLSNSPQQLAEGWINKQLERYEFESLGHLAAIEKETGALVGVGGILPRELNGKNYLEIAYSLKPEFWGIGYGTEIAKQMKSFGTENKLASHFVSIIHENNKYSMAVATKNGMLPLFSTTFLGMDVIVFGDEVL